MKQQFNRIFSALLALLLCVGLFAQPASADELSGTCGEDLTWVLDNGVLTISGSGAMDDYGDNSDAPWLQAADQIQRVVVTDGVTAVGSMAFYHCTNLAAVLLPDSVTSLGELAFAGCTALTQITMNGVQKIGSNCFNHCSSLVNLVLPEGLQSIGDKAFYRCSHLGGITVPKSVETIGHSAFAYCNNLVYAKILAPISVLPNWTFYSCELLWQLYLPDSIAKVEQNAVGECDSLYYVDFGGSDPVKEEIRLQLDQNDRNSETATKTEVTFVQTEAAIITTTTTVQTGISQWQDDVISGTIVQATITDQNGWDDLIDAVNNAENRGYPPAVEVEILDEVAMDNDALTDLAESGVTVTIRTPGNVSWEVILDDQTPDTLSSSQDFTFSIVKNVAGAYSGIFGNAVNYTVTVGNVGLNTTVKFPLGMEAARQVATLYAVKNKTLEKLSSVIVDDEGMAAFCLAGTVAGEYVLALNVQGIAQEEVTIPQALAPSYNIDYSGSTLTDAQGNQYIITGTRNDIGFGLGTLTLIVVGVLVGSTVIVGAVMITINKSRRKTNPYPQKHG